MTAAPSSAEIATNTVPSAAGRPRLVTEHLSVHFGSRSALEEINLTIEAGERIGLLGPNGAGKSTLLNCLAGVLAPSHGVVRFDGQIVRRPHQSIVYVPQRSGADWGFPIDVLGVTLMGRSLRRSRLTAGNAGDREEALAALERVGMRDLAHVQIGQLSGGQQQRVFLARALLQAGQVLLLDEPFAGVDVPTQELLINLLRGLSAHGTTIVYATHDLAQAAIASDRVVLLNHRLIADGAPSRVMTADNLIAAFGGQAVVPFAAADIEPAATAGVNR